MNVYISVISHGHGELIKKLKCLNDLSGIFNVIIKSNIDEDIGSYCKESNIHYINESYNMGFGSNNNTVFNFCKNKLRMNSDDYFIVLNPDVLISSESVTKLINNMQDSDKKIAGINLYKDKDFTIYDNSVRSFPNLIQFFLSFLGFGNDTCLDKSIIDSVVEVDWVAGSFIAFKSEHYEKLRGFDENYFMYCEDIDICYRSSKKGHKVTYYPNIKALHLAKHENRKIFSKHFVWHVRSVFRFIFSKMNITTQYSSIKISN